MSDFDFRDRLYNLQVTAADIMQLGYSQRTAYAWIKGDRRPRPYLQDHIIEELQKIKKKGNTVDAPTDANR